MAIICTQRLLETRHLMEKKKYLGRSKFSKYFCRELPRRLIFLPEFWFEWFALRKIDNFLIFRNLSQEMSTPLIYSDQYFHPCIPYLVNVILLNVSFTRSVACHCKCISERSSKDFTECIGICDKLASIFTRHLFKKKTKKQQ